MNHTVRDHVDNVSYMFTFKLDPSKAYPTQ